MTTRTIDEIISAYGLKYCIINDGDISHIIMAYPYKPYKPLGVGYAFIDAFYVASNTLYWQAKQISQELSDNGYTIVPMHLSLKPLGEQGGLGTILHNRLLTNREYGSKMTLQAITVQGKYCKILQDTINVDCNKCKLCDKACPSRALDGGVLTREKCLRYIQDFPDKSVPTMGNRVLGCEECQKACPYNAKIGEVDMPKELQQMLAVDNLKSMVEQGKKGLEPLAKYIGGNYARKKYMGRVFYC